MVTNARTIHFTVVSTLPAKNIPDFLKRYCQKYQKFTPGTRQNRIESPYFNANFNALK